MKIGLINPAWGDRRAGLNSTALYRSVPPQGLLQLASLTPLEHEVTITDENWQALDFSSPYDVVGITGTTVQIPRAYAIADEFRRRGVTVLMGGPHVSFLTREAALHADSIIRWEADEVWECVLDDFLNRRLQKVYNPKLPKSLDFKVHRLISRTFQIETPSWLPMKIRAATVQTQRGCPHKCDFCSVTTFNGLKVRQKLIDYVIKEIQSAKVEGTRFLLFLDDNIVADKEYARELFRALIPLRIPWLSQTDISIADDDILDLAVKSGMKIAMIGFESIDAATLGKSVSVAKKSLREKYEKGLAKLYRRGVLVHGGFVFGFDNEVRGQSILTVDWAIKNRLGLCQFTLATPLPGTRLFRRLDKQGRIETYDWSRYGLVTGCCVVKGQDGYREALEANQRDAYKKFYSFGSLVKRFNWRLSPFNQLLWLMMQTFGG